jgi:hypothetical protein
MSFNGTVPVPSPDVRSGKEKRKPAKQCAYSSLNDEEDSSFSSRINFFYIILREKIIQRDL